jgi:hypothetical protein
VRGFKLVNPQWPWWQLSRTVRQGYWMGGIFLLVGLWQLVTFPGGGRVSKWLGLGIGVFATVLGILCLTSAVALRRRELRLSAPESGSDETPRL